MLKTLGSQIKEYKLVSILTPLCMIFEVIFETIIPLLMGNIVDYGISKGNMNYVYRTGIVMLVMALGGLVTGGLGAIFGAKASMGFGKNLRKAMYENIQTFSFSNIVIAPKAKKSAD